MFGLAGKIFISCLVAAIASAAFAAKVPLVRKSVRVIGGRSAEIKERPYLVQIRDSAFGLFVCGGTLVDRTHVVTAAHCVAGRDPVSEYEVVGNASTIFEEGIKSKIVATHVHPSYGIGHQFANDVAIFTLATPLVGKYIVPIGISFDDIKDEEFVEISGWGTTEEGITGTVELIRTARVAKLPAEECKQKYSTYKGVTPSMICAATPGKDACSGDSGGPGICRGKLCLIVSWGKGCAQPDYPGVYTSLKSVRDFVCRILKINQ